MREYPYVLFFLSLAISVQQIETFSEGTSLLRWEGGLRGEGDVGIAGQDLPDEPVDPNLAADPTYGSFGLV